MRVFNGFNNSGGSVCPVCQTGEDKQTVLIGIDGTEDGNNIEAIQVHLDCINLRCDKNQNTGTITFYQFIRDINAYN